jgi:Ni,Fe-hydrogenase I small subunit
VFCAVVAIGNFGAVRWVPRTKIKDSSLGKVRQAIAEISVMNIPFIKPINHCPFFSIVDYYF